MVYEDLPYYYTQCFQLGDTIVACGKAPPTDIPPAMVGEPSRNSLRSEANWVEQQKCWTSKKVHVEELPLAPASILTDSQECLQRVARFLHPPMKLSPVRTSNQVV